MNNLKNSLLLFEFINENIKIMKSRKGKAVSKVQT
jgi:hypothetical protein